MTGAIDLAPGLFSRTHAAVPPLAAELSPTELLWRPDPAANSIAWLVWHLTRIQDGHLAEVAGEDVAQVWTSQGWVDRFGLPYDEEATGYGQTPEEVGAFV